MSTVPRPDRRTFITDLGRGAFALAVVGLAGCAPTTTTPATTTPVSPPAGSGTPPVPPAASPASPSTGTAPALAWSRVNLGFVSAYVLVRNGEAAIIDTGVDGSADEIEAALDALGLAWPAVGHLIVTHHHGDHAGSAAAIMELAPDLAVYAGAADIPSITVPRAPVPVTDGDRVFDLEIVATPGHTPGHVCAYDRGAGLLVAGDALRTDRGRPVLPDAQYTDDMDEALASVAKLGALTFDTLLVGHGEPLESGASDAVGALADS